MAKEPKPKKLKLEDFPAKDLAAFMEDYASKDRAFKKALTLLLASQNAGDKFTDELKKQMATIAKATSYLDATKSRALLRDLDLLQNMILQKLGEKDAETAYSLMWDFYSLLPDSYFRLGGSQEKFITFANSIAQDFVQLVPRVKTTHSIDIAKKIWSLIEKSPVDITLSIIANFAKYLEGAGRIFLTEQTYKALAKFKKRNFHFHEEEIAKEMHITRLLLLADQDDDVEAYIKATQQDKNAAAYQLPIAMRYFKAENYITSLSYIDPKKPFAEQAGVTTLNLHLNILEKLGRKKEKSLALKNYFEITLEAGILKLYLQSLPDFEDYEEEKKALEFAANAPHIQPIIRFFCQWGQHKKAEELLFARHKELFAPVFETQIELAELFNESCPEAACFLYRHALSAMVTHGVNFNSQIKLAKQAFQKLEEMRGLISKSPRLETHATYMAEMEKKHGRKAVWLAAKEAL